MTAKSLDKKSLLLALLVVVVWGLNFVVIEIGLKTIPPLFLSFARFFLFLPLVFFVKRPSIPFRMVFYYGLTMFALQFAFLFMGMYAGVPAGLTAIIDQVQVFFTILTAVVFLKEKVNLWQIIGALVAFYGIGIVGMHFGGGVTLSGFLLIIVSAIAWTAGNIISKKIGKIEIIPLVVWSSMVAWPLLLILSLVVEGPQVILNAMATMSLQGIAAVCYITFLSTLFGYGTWSLLLHNYSVGTVAPFTLLVPIVATLGSAIFLGESLQSWKIQAGFLVLAGLGINLLGSRYFAKKK